MFGSQTVRDVTAFLNFTFPSLQIECSPTAEAKAWTSKQCLPDGPLLQGEKMMGTVQYSTLDRSPACLDRVTESC